MVKPSTPLRVLQRRLLWFFGLLSIIGIGAGYYFQSSLYAVIGFLGLGVVIGGLVRIVLDRRQLK
jgi:hypothetical protein